MRISDWSSDVCSSDLDALDATLLAAAQPLGIDLQRALEVADADHHVVEVPDRAGNWRPPLALRPAHRLQEAGYRPHRRDSFPSRTRKTARRIGRVAWPRLPGPSTGSRVREDREGQI